MRISPQPPSMLAGFRFSGCELPCLVVPHESPCEAVANHFHVNEAVPKVAADSHSAVPSVDVDHLDAHHLSKHSVREGLPGLCAESLGFPRRVDAGESDSMLQVRRVENRQCVSIDNRRDRPTRRGGTRSSTRDRLLSRFRHTIVGLPESAFQKIPLRTRSPRRRAELGWPASQKGLLLPKHQTARVILPTIA